MHDCECMVAARKLSGARAPETGLEEVFTLPVDARLIAQMPRRLRSILRRHILGAMLIPEPPAPKIVKRPKLAFAMFRAS